MADGDRCVRLCIVLLGIRGRDPCSTLIERCIAARRGRGDVGGRLSCWGLQQSTAICLLHADDRTILYNSVPDLGKNDQLMTLFVSRWVRQTS